MKCIQTDVLHNSVCGIYIFISVFTPCTDLQLVLFVEMTTRLGKVLAIPQTVLSAIQLRKLSCFDVSRFDVWVFGFALFCASSVSSNVFFHKKRKTNAFYRLRTFGSEV